MNNYMKLMSVKGLVMSMDEQLYQHLQKDSLTDQVKDVIVQEYFKAIVEQLKDKDTPIPLEENPDVLINKLTIKNITINGIKKEVKSNELSYDDLLRLTFNTPAYDIPHTITYTYVDGEKIRSGFLSQRKELLAMVDGMNINIADTSKA